MLPYYRERAVEYAKKWALSKNPAYYYFGGIGGDCTNFISQCLLAGGGLMNFSKFDGWYYLNINNRAPSWTSVFYLKSFLTRQNDTVGPFGHLASINTLEIGDIIQLKQTVNDFNHTLIISQIENGEIYVCAHSNDALNRPLSSYYYIELQGIKIDGVRN